MQIIIGYLSYSSSTIDVSHNSAGELGGVEWMECREVPTEGRSRLRTTVLPLLFFEGVCRRRHCAPWHSTVPQGWVFIQT